MIEAVTHGLNLLGGMTNPVGQLMKDAQGSEAPVREGRVAGEPLVGDVGVVLIVAGRFDDVGARPAVADRQFGAPGGGVQGPGEVDVP